MVMLGALRICQLAMVSNVEVMCKSRVPRHSTATVLWRYVHQTTPFLEAGLRLLEQVHPILVQVVRCLWHRAQQSIQVAM
jgi:hypothetical protein